MATKTAVQVAASSDRRSSRLRRLNDGALICVLAFPQLIWLAVVVYLLHRGI